MTRLLVALALLAGCASETEHEGLFMRVELDGEMQDVRAEVLCYVEDDGKWDAVVLPFTSRARVEYMGQAYWSGGQLIVWFASVGAEVHPLESDDPDASCDLSENFSDEYTIDVSGANCDGDMVFENPIRITGCRDYEDALASGELD